MAFDVKSESTGLNVKAIIPWVRIVVRLIPFQLGWNDKLRRKPEATK